MGYLSSYTDNANEEKWVQIDLGKKTRITRIKLYPSHNNIRKVIDYYFPQAYKIEVSNDGETWVTCVEKNQASAPGGKPVDLRIDPIEGRYVRLVATKLQYYKHRIHDYEDRGDRTNRSICIELP